VNPHPLGEACRVLRTLQATLRFAYFLPLQKGRLRAITKN
jgi:hypothetical protein